MAGVPKELLKDDTLLHEFLSTTASARKRVNEYAEAFDKLVYEKQNLSFSGGEQSHEASRKYSVQQTFVDDSGNKIRFTMHQNANHADIGEFFNSIPPALKTKSNRRELDKLSAKAIETTKNLVSGESMKEIRTFLQTNEKAKAQIQKAADEIIERGTYDQQQDKQFKADIYEEEFKKTQIKFAEQFLNKADEEGNANNERRYHNMYVELRDTFMNPSTNELNKDPKTQPCPEYKEARQAFEAAKAPYAKYVEEMLKVKEWDEKRGNIFVDDATTKSMHEARGRMVDALKTIGEQQGYPQLDNNGMQKLIEQFEKEMSMDKADKHKSKLFDEHYDRKDGKIPENAEKQVNLLNLDNLKQPAIPADILKQRESQLLLAMANNQPYTGMKF